MKKKELELYIHVPFCVRKCFYCDFLSAPAVEEEREAYIEILCERIKAHGKLLKDYKLVSIFLGGGTPSILTAEQTGRILAAIREGFSDALEEASLNPAEQVSFNLKEKAFPGWGDIEITTELNPGTVTREKLLAYKSFGINRLSIGLQSADDRELKTLGRIHNYQEFLDTYRMAREAGFTNINIDLMSAIPGQTLKSYEETLRKIAVLSPEHISAYSLIIEEGTPFYEWYGEGGSLAELPDEETERLMYARTKEILKEYGYERYEISNYAKPGFECRHNLGYWERREYLGLGAGASSLIGNVRFIEPVDIKTEHISDLYAEKEQVQVLSSREQMEEFMFLGLRKMKGISVRQFYELFNTPIEDVYGRQINELVGQGLIEYGEYIRLTERGIDVSNRVLAEFLL